MRVEARCNSRPGSIGKTKSSTTVALIGCQPPVGHKQRGRDGGNGHVLQVPGGRKAAVIVSDTDALKLAHVSHKLKRVRPARPFTNTCNM
eukprot:scaffold656152_cov57-Prasinocladus_malaysianus.AAC.1